MTAATAGQPAEEIVRASNGLLEGLAERLGARARAASIYGEPVERGGVTVIPVARALWGFGGGGARGAGSGGGGGMILLPVGYIEISHGRSRFRPILGPGLIAAIVLVALSIVRRATERRGRR